MVRAQRLFVLAASSALFAALETQAAVRITEVMYNPPQGAQYEYIEIHNDGAAAVGIGDWAFTDGINFVFPVGTTIPAGGYLVVSGTKASLQAAYPSLDPAKIFGDHQSSLDNNGERITLADASANVVESFRFDDDLPWDPLADGFGASLERICLTSAAQLAENWRASPLPADPADFGGSPGGPNDVQLCPPEFPARPRVFISEVMYHAAEENSIEDEHEFIEIHNAEPQDVVLTGWRIAGGTDFAFSAGTTIAAGAYRVVARNPQRLAAVASYGLTAGQLLGGYTRTLDNGGEKIVLIGADGQGVDSMSYDDDFPWPEGADALGADEEWLSPTLLPLSQHRYRGISLERVSFDEAGGEVHNWAPSPLDGATPGKANANAKPVPPAIVADLVAVPATGTGTLIRSNQQAQVRARFSPPGFVTAAEIEYFIDDVAATNETTTKAPMSDDGAAGNDPVPGDDEFSVLLPQRPDNSIVRYRIRANRGAGMETISPRPSDPRAWHAYFVSPTVNTTTRLYQVIISPANWGTMWSNAQGGRVSGCNARTAWDATVPAVLVHEGRVIDVFARYQGSRYNRTNGPTISSWPYPGPTGGPSPLRALSWRFSLPRYEQIDGQSVITLNKLTQGCPGYEAGVGYRLMARAGVPAPETRYARLHINGGYYHYMIQYERPGEEMMRRYHREREAADPSLPRENEVGHLFKSAGCNCDEGPYGWGDARILSAQCGHTALTRYRYTYDRKTHGWDSHEEFASMIEELNALRGDDESLRLFFEERFDFEILLNYLAIMNYSVPFDDMFQNHFFYQRLSDGKWMILPWDLDLNFGGWKGANASLYVGEQGDPDNRSGWWNYLKDAFLKSYRTEFNERLFELNNTLLHPSEINKLVDEVMATANPTEAAQAPAGVACNFAGDASNFKSFAAQRFNIINSQVSGPLADAGPDQTVFAGTQVKFDASNSRPDPGPGVTYSWSNGMSGEKPARIFDQVGEFTITLTVSQGASQYTDTITITVMATPAGFYAEANGIVSIEAEHFFANDRHGAPGVQWAARRQTAGFSGTDYMLADDGGTRVTFPSGFASTSPELRYAIKFAGTGAYRVWIRGFSSSSNADSCHVGLNGGERPEGFASRFTVDAANYLWSGVTRDQGNQTITVQAAGLHYLSIWVRESGQIVDKIVIAKDAAFTPSGNGPAESALVPPTTNPSFIRGDANGDGSMNLVDAVAILFHLFAPAPRLACEDHADLDDNTRVTTTDAIYVLQYLFRSGPPPSQPFPDKGFDPTANDPFTCGDG